MINETTTPTPIPVPMGWVIRILEPSDLASSVETRVYGSVEEMEPSLTQLVEKLHYNGVEEYLIHIVNQSTGAVERTLRRKVKKSYSTEVTDVRG